VVRARLSWGWLAPLLAGALAVAAWQLIELAVNAPFPVVPPPGAILGEAVHRWPVIMLNLRQTFGEALAGFVLGNLLGLVIAVLMVSWPSFEGSVYNLIVTVHSIPLIAIAPLLVIWLGNGSGPEVVIAAMACFFPMAVNMNSGLRAAHPLALDLMRSLNASPLSIFRHVLLPTAMPYLLTALKMGAPAAVLGATVGEWLGTGGLGYLLFSSMVNFNVPLLWATMLVSTLLALAGFALFAVIESVTLRWHAASRTQGAS
jgi:NitT/TauT family transport system permease protein